MRARILVVDDDATIRDTFQQHLSESGHVVETADSAENALNRLKAFDPALVITDVRMPGLSGIELLQRLKSAHDNLAVIVITAHEDMRSAVDAMKAGAYDYLVKPLDLDHIDLVIARAIRDRAAINRLQQLSEQAAQPYGLDRLIGRDPRMIEIYKLIGTLATNRTCVLIRGETGTGKELIARAIHYNSEQSAEPFVAVNCTAVPETLLESELFGHVRGAFTGAIAERRGHFQRAGTGTIFLDEIGDTSLAFQAKLLRVLQEREFYPLGGEGPRRTDARVIAATHRPIEDLVREGKFREDLYFRLRVVEIRIPALRERRADIRALADGLLNDIAREMHRRAAVIPDAVMKALEKHDWPGNVRELQNALTRALVTSRSSVITAEALALQHLPATQGAAQDDSLAAVERRHIERVLNLTGGNKRQACRVLRVSRPRLDRLIERHKLFAENRDRKP